MVKTVLWLLCKLESEVLIDKFSELLNSKILNRAFIWFPFNKSKYECQTESIRREQSSLSHIIHLLLVLSLCVNWSWKQTDVCIYRWMSAWNPEESLFSIWYSQNPLTFSKIVPRLVFDIFSVQNVYLNTSYGKFLSAQMLCKRD